MATRKKATAVSANDPNAVPGDAPADPSVTPDPLVVTTDPLPSAVDTPENVVPSPAPIVTSTDADGNVVEEDAPVANNPVDPAGATTADAPNPAAAPFVSTAADPPSTSVINIDLTGTSDPTVPGDSLAADPVVDDTPGIVTADTPSAAAAVLARPIDTPVTDVVESRAEVNAQQAIDQGLDAPVLPGQPVRPTETLDGHTVDPSGTADDQMPAAAPVAAPGDTSLSTPAPVVPDVSAKGPGTLDVDSVSLAVTALAEAYAELGVHKDVLSAAVDAAYANLQSQRSTAQTAGQPDPFPLLAI